MRQKQRQGPCHRVLIWQDRVQIHALLGLASEHNERSASVGIILWMVGVNSPAEMHHQVKM